jgi:hypothetical protein
MKRNSGNTDPANAWQVKNGDAAQYFKSSSEFYAVQVRCPSWGSSNESITLKFFKWNNDYETTTSAEPIYTYRAVNYSDNEWMTLYADAAAKSDHSIRIPAGEYLWLATDGTTSAGVWGCASGASTGGMSPRSYKSGKYVSNFQFESRVLTEYSEGSLYWDKGTYQRSSDGGKTWTEEVASLIPTEFSQDALSCCDPGVAKWGGWYYIGYTSTEDSRGTDNNVFVGRSKNPEGPWEKWNGSGWGGKPMPVIQYHGVGSKDSFGAGEPCFVIVGDTIYFYYSWNDPKPMTKVSTASAKDENWPGNLTYKGIAIDKSTWDAADHSDVKYRPDLGRFYAINTASRMTENAFIQLWSSDDGLKFKFEGKMKGTGFKPGLHNCGWSGDELGHQDPTKPQYIAYAYGIGTWGQWNTWFAPLTFPKK